MFVEWTSTHNYCHTFSDNFFWVNADYYLTLPDHIGVGYRVVNLTLTIYRIYVFDRNYSCNYTASAVRMNFTLFTPICNYRQIGATGENSGNMCQKYSKFHSFVGENCFWQPFVSD